MRIRRINKWIRAKLMWRSSVCVPARSPANWTNALWGHHLLICTECHLAKKKRNDQYDRVKSNTRPVTDSYGQFGLLRKTVKWTQSENIFGARRSTTTIIECPLNAAYGHSAVPPFWGRWLFWLYVYSVFNKCMQVIYLLFICRFCDVCRRWFFALSVCWHMHKHAQKRYIVWQRVRDTSFDRISLAAIIFIPFSCLFIASVRRCDDTLDGDSHAKRAKSRQLYNWSRKSLSTLNGRATIVAIKTN